MDETGGALPAPLGVLAFGHRAPPSAPQAALPRRDYLDDLGRACRTRCGLHGLEEPQPTDQEAHVGASRRRCRGPDPERERQEARCYWTRRRGEFLASVLGGRVNKTAVVDTALRTLIGGSRRKRDPPRRSTPWPRRPRRGWVRELEPGPRRTPLRATRLSSGSPQP
jgi:hypothetical protein